MDTDDHSCELNTKQKRILSILDSLTTANRFFATGSCPLELPGLVIDRVGDVGLPLAAAVAKKLIRVARQAPYGKGEETIVDTDVRRVWQIEPDKVEFDNARWPVLMDQIAQNVGDDLGLNSKISCNFYKLLIYEKGSFFATHRDTEKQDRMFATLVIALPSRHAGGELILRHDGEEHEIRFDDKQAQFELRYAAFYADCEHEVKPVTQGYRVNLVYNLSLTKQKKQPTAPQHQQETTELSSLLPSLLENSDQEKIVLPLAHHYSESGLKDALLKGEDRTRVDVLQRVANQLDYDLHLATVVRWQSGYPDYDTIGHDSGYGRYRRNSEPDYSNAEWEEVFNETTTLESWFTAKGLPLALGEMKLNASEFLSSNPLDELPFTQEINEATGNEGISMERWYRQAVVVLWPSSRNLRILAGQGTAASVPHLRKLIESNAEVNKSACLELAEAIIDNWTPPQHHYGYNPDRDGTTTEFSKAVADLADLKLSKRYLAGVIALGCDGTEGPALARLLVQVGWNRISSELKKSVAKHVPKTEGADLKSIVEVVHDICVAEVKADKKHKTVLLSLLAELQAVIMSWDKYRDKSWSRRDRGREGILELLYAAYDATGDAKPLSEFVSYVATKPKKYDLHQVLIPAVRKLAGGGLMSAGRATCRKCFQQLRDHCIARLETLTAKPVKEPTHWAQKVNIKCDCEDCQQLQLFLHDKHATVLRFKVRKERRHHLHRQVQAHKCDLDHVTDRRGSPQTLVCTKNRSSYTVNTKAFEENLKLLDVLREV